MSYEGYTDALCPLGHLNSWDAHDYDRPYKCEICDGCLVWWTNIDQTNCDTDPETGLEWGKVELKVAVPAVYKTCEHCKHSERVETERYEIPTHAGFTNVGNFVVNLAESWQSVIARKLTDLGFEEKDCSFNWESQDRYQLQVEGIFWPSHLVPQLPPMESPIGRVFLKPGESYVFSRGPIIIKMGDLLKCENLEELFDRAEPNPEGHGCSWKIKRAQTA